MARLLVGLRGNRHQAEAAALVGLTQAKISRAERDLFPLSPAEIDTYAAALGATDEDRTKLVALAEAEAAHRAAASRTALVRVGAAIQRQILILVQSATAVRAWQERMVLGDLQTPAYTAAMLEGDGQGDPGAAWWAARRARVAMLDDPGRTWHLLMSEAALRWGIGSPQVMTAQIDHLVEVSGWAHIRMGIVPLDKVHAIRPPSAFHLYENGAITAEVATPLGAAFPDKPVDVQALDEEFRRLAGLALYDDEGRKLLARIRKGWK